MQAPRPAQPTRLEEQEGNADLRHHVLYDRVANENDKRKVTVEELEVAA